MNKKSDERRGRRRREGKEDGRREQRRSPPVCLSVGGWLVRLPVKTQARGVEGRKGHALERGLRKKSRKDVNKK